MKLQYMKKYEGMKYTRYDKNSNVMTANEPLGFLIQLTTSLPKVYNKGSTVRTSEKISRINSSLFTV